MTTPDIRKAIENKLGIAELNPMQSIMAETDFSPFTMLLAPTGSGKTLAFTIGALRRLGTPGAGVSCVVVTPSRELTVQVGEIMRRMADGFKTLAIYGGHSMREETQSLSVEPDIVVATPGRLLDHLSRGSLNLNALKVMVLDEWDKTLQLGFEDEMKRICSKMQQKPSTVILTSATSATRLPEWLPVPGKPEILDFTADSSLTPGATAPVEVVEVPSESADKLVSLTELLMTMPDSKVIVFVNHRESVARTAAALAKAGVPVGEYHGALEQLDRSNALEMLANGTTPVLVATDLGARGLDIEGLDAVVHYHLPLTADAWTHRNGRTGRMGARGVIYAITSERDSVGDFIKFNRKYVPNPPAGVKWHKRIATLHFDLGRKDKVSRGDIVGFLIAQGGLTADEIGRISVADHSALAAVPVAKLGEVLGLVKGAKLKGKRVRVSALKRLSQPAK